MLERIYKSQKLMRQACDKLGRELNIMEVCGTHTVSIFRNGIKSTLPPGLNMLSGPGCPVCVTDAGYVDTAVSLADNNDVIVATYGDMLRVPGSNGSLEKSRGHNVRVVLSSMDAVKLAAENPAKTVVFLAVGFETTTPATAVAVKQAAQQGLDNFVVLSAHKRIPPAMEALLNDKNNRIDAFLCPGHVTVIIGSAAYEPLARQFARPCVVAGFEPMQIIEGLAAVCRQIIEDQAKVESIYDAVVTEQGNTTAKQIIHECFEDCEEYWRGLGKIKNSGYKLKPQYARFDAYSRLGLPKKTGVDVPGCRCGEVLCGLIDPPDCGMFGRDCVPDEPVGPCMVSSEGACAAWYKYTRKDKPKK